MELALCPAELVRELVDEVLGREADAPPEPAGPVGLEEGLGRALGTEAERFGISTRQTMPRDTSGWPAELEVLRAFDLDAVTADLGGREEAWGEAVLGLGGLAVLLWPADREPRGAFDLGVRWSLRVTRDPGGQLDWSLGPLQL